MNRDTEQRRAIKAVFAATERPLAPREVLDAAKHIAPRLGIATVYRAISALVEGGELAPVHLPGEPARYELSGKAHHHHFHCRGCGGAFEVTDCTGDYQRMTPSGFVLEYHEVVLYGLCPACAKTGC